MNLRLRSELGVDLLERHAIGLGAAVTAILAGILIYYGEINRRRCFAALLSPAPFIGALTVVKENCDSGYRREFSHRRLIFAAGADDGIGRQGMALFRLFFT